MLHQRTSRLSRQELVELTERVAALLPRPWTQPRGRPRALTPLVRAATAPDIPDDSHVSAVIADRIVLLDGTLAPVWS